MFIFIIIVVFFISKSFINEHFDFIRIQEDLASKGAEMLSIKWSSFGLFSMDQSFSRYYEVEYIDKQKNIRKALVKTSWIIGTWYSKDRIIEYPPMDNPIVLESNVLI